MTTEVDIFETVLDRVKKLSLQGQARLIAQLATTSW
jgi:hypothetical protein